MQPIVSTRPSLAWTRHNLHDGATCITHRRTSVSLEGTTRRRASASLEARLRNPNPTYFHTKQAVRSRHVSYTVFIPQSILWCNRQTVVRLVLRPKPTNRRSDFQSQITKIQLPVLRPKLENPPPPWFLCSIKKSTNSFEAKLRETVATGFEVKPEKPIPMVLKSNN
jgi:hypothetical protein